MANKHFNYRYRATAVAGSYGTGNFNVTASSSYNDITTLVNTTSPNQERFVYYLSTVDSAITWEYGIGYLTDLGGGNYQFVRETSLSSSESANDKITIQSSYGVVNIDVVAENPNFSPFERISSSSSVANVNSTYAVDAATNLTVSLPAISNDSVIIGIVLTSLAGVETERANALTLSPDGSDTVNSTTSYVVTKKNDYVRLVSDVTNTNWVVLDPISDAAASSGPDGSIQIAASNLLSNSTGLFFSSNALYVGGSGDASAAVKLSPAGNTFNLQSGNVDLKVHGNGKADLLCVDASQYGVSIAGDYPTDRLYIKSTGTEGMTVCSTTSGGIPVITMKNNDPDFTEGLDVGRIDFIGHNSIDENITYARILAEASDATDSSEEGLLKLQVDNNGTLQTVGLLTYEDIQVGPNNSISGGIVIGSNNTNKGNNVCLGYYSTNCGTGSINIGHQNNIQSGSYAGAIGSSHTVTGANIWVLGGSGASITGSNSTYLVSNDNNYIKIKQDAAQRIGFYVDSTGTEVNIVNSRISATGTEHAQSIIFSNTSGVAVTGTKYGVEVLNPASGSETSRFFVRVLQSGSPTDVLSISDNNVNLSNLSGLDDSVFVGSNLSVTGTGANITVVGLDNVVQANSGENTIVGYSNELSTSGNDHVVVVGNSNTVDDNYSTTVGTSNSNSGLYSAVVGYNNGGFGENLSIVGVNNDVSGNNSSVLGYQNNIDNHNVYVIGQGNTSTHSGVHIFGNNVSSTGHNTSYIKNTGVTITGSLLEIDSASVVTQNRPVLAGSGAMLVSGDPIGFLVNSANYVSSGDNISELVNDVNYVTSGDNISELVNNINYVTSGDNVSELVNDTKYVASGENISKLVNDAQYVVSGENVSHLTNDANYVSTGNNISLLVNDANYVASGDNVSELANDVGYRVLADNPTISFAVSNTGTNSFIFSGGGTNGAGVDETPDLYLYRGFTYNFNCTGLNNSFTIIHGGGALPISSGTTNNTGVFNGTVSYTPRHAAPESGTYYANPGATVSGNIYIVK